MKPSSTTGARKRRPRQASPNVNPLVHKIADTMALLSCGHSTVYELVKAGRLDVVKILGCTRITDESIRRLLSSGRKRASRAA
jgi:hypothetical protein